MVLIRSHRAGGCSRLAPPGASQLVASPYSDVSSVSAALGSALTFLPAASHSEERTLFVFLLSS